MTPFNPWKSWTPHHRTVGYITGILFFAAMILLWVNYFNGYDAILQWEKLQEQKSVESTLHVFSVGPFELSVPAENFVVYEYFNGSDLHPNKIVSRVFMLMLALAAIVMISIFSTYERFWFLMGMLLFILFGVSLRLRILEIFGQLNYVPVGVWLLIMVSAAAYFNIVRNDTPFLRRLFVFGILTALMAVVVIFFSRVPHPVLHLAVTAYPVAMVLTLLFILLVAHEIPAFFISLLGSTSSGSRNLSHFLLFSLIYLVNLALSVMNELNITSWDLIYINPYLLLCFSAVMGIAGFKNRERMYENIMPFAPVGALFYLSLGTIALVTIAMLLGSMNDAAIQVIRQIILFSHLGFGLIFVMYVLANFGSMLSENLPVHKVLYKPNRMPYFTFQFAGLIVTLAFVFYAGWRGYIYHGVAAFYNALGDLDLQLENNTLAKAHFEQAAGYSFQDHHANYALAKLSVNAYYLEESHRRYQLANGRTPTNYSLVNKGNLYLWQGQYFDAINTFRDADAARNSGVLENNLGYAFAKIYNVDSAVHYLNQSRGHDRSRSTAETNFFALAATEFLPVDSDSVLRYFQSTYTATIANALALANAQNQDFDLPVDPPVSSRLNLYRATLLNNYLIHESKTIDSVTLQKVYETADANPDYSEALKVPVATAYYFQHNVRRALQIMGELAFISSGYQGKYNYLMGLWALEQGNPALAASYFDYALRQNYKDARLYKAIALSEDRQLDNARVAWDSVAASGDDAERAIALRMKKILDADPAEAMRFPEPERYQFLRYRLSLSDTALFSRIVATFDNNNYSAKALLDMAKRQFESGELTTAIRYINRLKGLPLTDETLYREIRFQELLMLAERRELTALARQINEDITFTDKELLHKKLFTALISEGNGDSSKAEEQYRLLAVYNPYFEEGIIAAAQFFRDKDPKSLRAYNILAEAVQVNDQSVKLWNAYITEAARMGFGEYAASALNKLQELKIKQSGR